MSGGDEQVAMSGDDGDLWEEHAGWWQDGFTAGADPEYEEQILPLAAAELGAIAPGLIETPMTAGMNEKALTSILGPEWREFVPTTAAQVQQVGAFNVVNVQPVTISSGDFVVGIKLTQAENVFPFALDTTKSRTRSYRSLDGLTFELIDSLGSFGNYGIRARLVRPAKLIIGATSSLVTESCLPANKVIDPGETVTVSLSLGNNGSSATQNLMATLLPSSNVITADQTRSYGAMIPGSAAVARQFTFTASGACGGNLPINLSLKDGDQDLGVVTFNFTLGAIGTTTQTFSYAGEATKIPDGDSRGVSLPIVVSGFPSTIADLNFRIDGTQCSSSPGATGVGVGNRRRREHRPVEELGQKVKQQSANDQGGQRTLPATEEVGANPRHQTFGLDRGGARRQRLKDDGFSHDDLLPLLDG